MDENVGYPDLASMRDGGNVGYPDLASIKDKENVGYGQGKRRL